jgi:transposase
VPSGAALGVATQKKSLHATDRDTHRVQQAREDYHALIQALDLQRFKFVDESGVNLAMTRRFGRALLLLYLPQYSPDLAPIEQVWSKIKTFLRTAKARTREALELAIEQALATITAMDTHGWFTSCGYTIP